MGRGNTGKEECRERGTSFIIETKGTGINTRYVCHSFRHPKSLHDQYLGQDRIARMRRGARDTENYKLEKWEQGG